MEEHSNGINYLDGTNELDQTLNHQNDSINYDTFEEDGNNLNNPGPQTSVEIDSDVLCVLNSLIDQTCTPSKKLLPARDRRVEETDFLSDYEENKVASQKYQLWGLYWNRSQTSFSITARDDYIVKTVVRSLVDTIDAYEKQQRNKIDTIFGIKDQRQISNFNRHNPVTARKRILNKYTKGSSNVKKQRYNYNISSDSDSPTTSKDYDEITVEDSEMLQDNSTKKRRVNPLYRESYDKFRKKSKHVNKDEEDVDPTFTPQSTVSKKLLNETNIRRSKRFSRKSNGLNNLPNKVIETVILDSDNESEILQPSKNGIKRSLRSAKSNKTSNRKNLLEDNSVDKNLPSTSTKTNSLKMFEEAKRKSVRTKLELGIKMSNLKQRMDAKETVINDLKEKYEFINSMKEKLDLERAQTKADISMAKEEKDKAVTERDSISAVNIQLQNENTRIRKINVQLQNTIITLDKKLRDKLATFERLGLDGDDTFGRFNPYSTTTKLDAKKNRQRMLFNCADVIAAGTIDDGISLVADLHADLQLDPSIKEVGRGLPVLSEINKTKQKKGDKQNVDNSSHQSTNGNNINETNHSNNNSALNIKNSNEHTRIIKSNSRPKKQQ